MDYKNLKFFGHYIHDIGDHERALAVVKSEMNERKADHNAPSGYAGNVKFLEESRRFRDDYTAMRDEMLERAREGKSVSRDEYITLCRAEKLCVRTNWGSDKVNGVLRLVDAGKNAFSPSGMSDSRLIGKLTGLDGESKPKDRITFDLMPQR